MAHRLTSGPCAALRPPPPAQGYAFNTFGEVFACWVQDILLVCLIARYSGLPLWQAVVSGTAFVGICFYLLFGCPLYVLAALQACTVVVMALGSRLPQIMLNIKRGNSGMLSVTSCALNVAGNTARIFTTCVLTGDVLLLTSSLTQGCLNSILLWQVRQGQGQGGVAGQWQQAPC